MGAKLVDQHPKFALALTAEFCPAHPRKSFEAIAEVAGNFSKSELAHTTLVCQRHQADVVDLGDRELAHDGLLGVARHVVDTVDGSAQVVEGGLVFQVGEPFLPVDVDFREPLTRVADQLLDPDDSVDLVFELLGQQPLDLARRRAAPDRGDWA